MSTTAPAGRGGHIAIVKSPQGAVIGLQPPSEVKFVDPGRYD